MEDSFKDRYQRFIETHPTRQVDFDGREGRVQYLDCGWGEPLLLLPGLFSRGDSWFPLIEGLANRFQCFPVTYLSCSEIEQLSSAIFLLMDQLGFERMHLLGHSFGGMIAQYLVDCYPARFSSLVLAHSAPLPLHLRRRVQLLNRVISWLPKDLVRGLWRSWVPTRDDPKDQRFWAHYRHQRRNEVNRLEVSNHAGLFLDLCRSSASGIGWAGPVLIIESDNDPTFSPPARARLKQQFPQGKVAIFAGSGHASLIHDPERYRHEVTQFLSRVVATSAGARERMGSSIQYPECSEGRTISG